MQLGDDVPDISVHPDGEEENTGYLTEYQQQPQVMDTNISKTLDDVKRWNVSVTQVTYSTLLI